MIEFIVPGGRGEAKPWHVELSLRNDRSLHPVGKPRDRGMWRGQ